MAKRQRGELWHEVCISKDHWDTRMKAGWRWGQSRKQTDQEAIEATTRGEQASGKTQWRVPEGGCGVLSLRGWGLWAGRGQGCSVLGPSVRQSSKAGLGRTWSVWVWVGWCWHICRCDRGERPLGRSGWQIGSGADRVAPANGAKKLVGAWLLLGTWLGHSCQSLDGYRGGHAADTAVQTQEKVLQLMTLGRHLPWGRPSQPALRASPPSRRRGNS